MKKYVCFRCEKEFNYKHHLEEHLNKKNPCDKIIKIIDNNKIEMNIKEKDIKINKFIEKNNDDENKFTNKFTKVINAKMMKEYLDKSTCIYCEKKFSHKYNVLNHIKNNCKTVKEIEEEKHRIFEELKKKEEQEKHRIFEELKKKEEENQKIRQLEEEIKKLKEEKNKNEKSKEDIKLKQKDKDVQKIIKDMQKKMKEMEKNFAKQINNSNCNNTNTDNSINNSNNINSNNINSNNNQQNLYLVGYNKEDLSKIDKDEILAIMKRGFQAPVELTRTIHFNPKYPEFHNIFIPRINEKNGMVFVNGKWKIMDKNELVDDIYENKRDYIIQNLDNFIGQLNEYKKKSLMRWLNTDDNDDEAIINTKNDIKKVLYENRRMAMDRKKEIENMEKKKKLEIVSKEEISKKPFLIEDKKNNNNNSDSDFDFDKKSESSFDSSYISNFSYLSQEEEENNNNSES